MHRSQNNGTAAYRGLHERRGSFRREKGITRYNLFPNALILRIWIHNLQYHFRQKLHLLCPLNNAAKIPPPLSYLLYISLKILKILLSLNIIICFLSIFWDFYSGYHGWSINYVFPALCISYGAFVLILRFVNYFAFKENSSYIYLNICLGFIPSILVFLDKVSGNILIYASGLFAIINLLILLIFDGSTFKEDIAKKIHF